MTAEQGTKRGSARLAWIVAVVALVVAAVLGFLLVTHDDDEGGQSATEELYFEPAASIGPDAFTAPVTVEPGICDTALFLQELQSRPDALREWAKVLDIPVDAVPAYVETLEPMVLERDTAVMNHGLRNGQAYPRASTLEAGTAVLVDTEASAVVEGYAGVTPEVPEVPSSDSTESSSTPDTPNGSTPESSTTTTVVTTTTGPATTVPGGGLPVTRCKCGNPLLPLEVEEFTPGTSDTTSTTAPRGSTTTSSSTSSSSTSSSSTSSSTSSSVPDSSSSSSSSSSTPNDGSTPDGSDDSSTSSSIVVTPGPSDVDNVPARFSVPLPRR